MCYQQICHPLLHSLLPNLSFLMTGGKHPQAHHLEFSQRNDRKCLRLGQWKTQPRPHFCIFSVPCIPFLCAFPSQSWCEAMVYSPCYYHTNKPVEILGRSRGSLVSLLRGVWDKAKKKRTVKAEVHMACGYPPPDFSKEGEIGDSILSPQIRGVKQKIIYSNSGKGLTENLQRHILLQKLKERDRIQNIQHLGHQNECDGKRPWPKK